MVLAGGPDFEVAKPPLALDWDSPVSHLSSLLPLFSCLLVLRVDGYCGICRTLVREETSQIISPPPLDSEVLSKATLSHSQGDDT